MVDGCNIHEPNSRYSVESWQASIAHVPQSIYFDTSILENIAFGVPLNEIDHERAEVAARQAQLTGFIDEQLNGYQTLVGERGVRLSGGQRQRIGIARALYKRASILVFDEATSALDVTTENSVIESIHDLNKEVTIIMIAHRLSTIEACDRVIRLESGRIVEDCQRH